MEFVYHGSPTSSLNSLKPSSSSSGRIYAAPDKMMSVPFLNRAGAGLVIGVHRINGIPTITEFLPDAFEYRYHQQSGSIYTLDGSNHFKSGGWSEEVYSEFPQKTLNEEYIPDIQEYINDLISEGKIRLIRWSASKTDDALFAYLVRMIVTSYWDLSVIEVARHYLQKMRPNILSEFNTWLENKP